MIVLLLLCSGLFALKEELQRLISNEYPKSIINNYIEIRLNKKYPSGSLLETKKSFSFIKKRSQLSYPNLQTM